MCSEKKSPLKRITSVKPLEKSQDRPRLEGLEIPSGIAAQLSVEEQFPGN